MQGIELVIPMTAQEEIDGLCSLQNFFMGIDQNNVENSLKMLLRSDWVKYRKEVAQIARTMVLTAKYRPNALDSLITLFSKLIENDGPNNSLRFLKNDVTKTIFRSMYVGKPFPGESSNFAFLFESMNNGIYTPEEITDKIRTFHFSNPKFYRTSAWLFAWFAPEIFHSDPKFYEQIKKHTIPTYKEIERYAKAIKKFIEKFDDYSANDFALLRTARLQSQHRATLLSIIKRDSVEGLINYFSFPMNNIFSRLEPSLYCPNPFIQYRPTFNMVAAFYGSVNAFKYFCGNDLSHDQLDNKLSNLAQFAIAGGCMEIIHMCEDIGCSFTMTAHIAALYHRIDILKWLHEKYKLDLNMFDSMGYTVLHRSAEGNCISAIKYCLENGCDINSTAGDGSTALSLAVRSGNIDTVRYLLGFRNIDLILGSETGNGPIHIAAKYGDLNILKMIIAHGVDINLKDDDGATALAYAAAQNQISVVKYLLALPNIEANEGGEGGTPFCRAAGTGNIALVSMLLNNKKIDVKKVIGQNYNALQCAMKQRKRGVLQMLLNDERFNPNDCTTVKKETSLHTAAKFGRNYASKLLLKYPEIDVNCVTLDGNTPLMYAVANRREKTLLNLLNDKRVEVNIANSNGETALTMSLCLPNAACLDLLMMREELLVNTKHASGMSPLHIAINNNKLDCLILLLRRKDLDVNVVSDNGMTPLILALLMKRKEMIIELCLDGRSDYDTEHEITLNDGSKITTCPRKIASVIKINGFSRLKEYIPPLS